MKIIDSIKRGIIGILGIVFFAFAVIMTILLLNFNDYGITQIDNTSLVSIKEELSSNKYKKGDLVLVEGRAISSIEPGDEIFIYRVDSTGVVRIDLGIIDEVIPEDKIVTFENGAAYDIEFVVGEASKVYEGVGTYLSLLQSKWGFLFIILVPCFLIFISQIYSLIIEIKYGDEIDSE